MNFSLLQPTSPSLWTGRIDDENDPDAFRFHQVVQVVDVAYIQSVFAKKKRYCLIGFACDEGVRRNQGRVGAAEGPFQIRKELAKLPANFSPEAELYDVGTIVCQSEEMEEAQRQLSELVTLVLENGVFPLVLGGGHEIVYGHYSGLRAYSMKEEQTPPVLINLDAHLDLRPTRGAGTSGTSFFQIAKEHQTKNWPFTYICLGLQTYGNTRQLYKTADQLGVQYYNAKDITEASKTQVLNQVMNELRKHESAYLTLDFDVLNSAYAPGVSSPQPFGISPEMLLYFVKPLLRTGKIKSLDIAEVAPRYDDDNQTAKLAAIVLYAIINVLVE